MSGDQLFFPLLELPAELRNRVYHHVLPAVGRYHGIGRGYANTVRDIQALSQVNRQLRTETLPMFYGNTEFQLWIWRVEDVDKAIRWLAQLENWQAALIRDFSLNTRCIHVRFIAKTTVCVTMPETPACQKMANQVAELLKGLHSSKKNKTGDSGLRVCHMAHLLRMVLCASNSLQESTPVVRERHWQLIRRLGDRRRKGT
jgi:hypothetical protein